MTPQEQRNLRAVLDHLVIGLRMDYTVENLIHALDGYLKLRRDHPEAAADFLRGLHESTFPRTTSLTPSTTYLEN